MVFEIYECLFEFKQGDKYVPKFYDELKILIDELEMHQPAVTDAATLRGYRQNLTVSKFQFGLSPILRSQVRDQRLGGDSIFTLIATFSRVMQISTGSNVSSTSSIEQSAMIFGRGRGRDRNFGGARRGSVRERGSYGDRQNAPEKGLRQCRNCERSNHIFAKCWKKFGRPKWAQIFESDPPAPCGTPQVSSSAHPGSSTSCTITGGV